MKKIIAIFLCLGTLLLLGAIPCEAANAYPYTEKKNGLVTIQHLENLSWEDIRNNYKELFNSGDDLYLKHIILFIDRDKDFDIQKNPFVSHNGMVYLKNIDYDTMCKKLQIILDAYNAVNTIQIKAYTKLYHDEPGHMSIDIFSSNSPATYVGETVKLKGGSIFYESSRNFGEGKCNTTFYIDCEAFGFARNPNIPEDYQVLINGISYLDDTGNISSCFYKTFDEIKAFHIRIPIDCSKTYMLHICTEKKDLGWVVPEAVKAIS